MKETKITETVEETQQMETAPAPEAATPAPSPAPAAPKKRDKIVTAAFVLSIVGTSVAALALILSLVSLGSHSDRSARFDRTTITEEFDRGGTRGQRDSSTTELERETTREFRGGNGRSEITEEEFLQERGHRSGRGMGHRSGRSTSEGFVFEQEGTQSS